MPEKTRRYTPKELRNSEEDIPAKLRFVLRHRIAALVRRSTSRGNEWAVELAPTIAKTLLESAEVIAKSKKVAQGLRKERKALREELAALRREVDELKTYNATLEANNAQLMKNIEEDGRGRNFQRSAKNYFHVAEERGTNLASKPLQGGLAGLEKK